MVKIINVENVKELILNKYKDIVCKNTYGETTFFYNPNNLLKNGVYFCTIKEQDGPNDKASQLNRNDVYRISTGITKEKFVEIFQEVPKRPLKGGIIDGNYNFSTKNVIMPHPIYGWMLWIQILSPDEENLNLYLNYTDISYMKAKNKFEKRLKG